MTITNGYCTRAELKAQVWPPGAQADTTEDTVFDQVITAAARSIDDNCDRRFFAASETRTFKAEFGDRLYVFDLLSVTTLKTDDGNRTYATTWATTDYDLGPENAALDGRPYRYIDVAPLGRYGFPVGLAKGVQIAGSFGYATSAPALIKQACLLQAARWYKRKDAIFGVVGSAEMGQLLVIPKLDPDVAQMIMHFQRGRGQIGAV